MSRKMSPFAELTAAEKQIKWLEYQSIRLPYIQGKMDSSSQAEDSQTPAPVSKEAPSVSPSNAPAVYCDRPQPPPEVPRTFQTSKHTQYDAVIARMKQAELQSHKYFPVSKSAEKAD